MDVKAMSTKQLQALINMADAGLVEFSSSSLKDYMKAARELASRTEGQ